MAFTIRTYADNGQGDTLIAAATIRNKTVLEKSPNAVSYSELDFSQTEPPSDKNSSNEVENLTLETSWMISSPNTSSQSRNPITMPIMSGDQNGMNFCPKPSFLFPRSFSTTETPPFSRRLQHSALERGYELITNAETPSSILCYAFKYCIQASTREEITSRMIFLLQQSLQGAFLGPTTDMLQGPISTQQSPLSKLLELKDLSPLPAPHFLPTSDLEAQPSFLPGNEFLNAKDVDVYLQSRGIVVTSKSQLIQLKIPEDLPAWQPKRYRTVILSASRLLDSECFLFVYWRFSN
ncbi:bzip family transcription factor [Penicillium taxi]|uniref:bzip family transcription factor n=1 Tax=Penicillium taxi TaxID=168475 RepID=UPI00254527A5|nr:bzip family transcription factor [Penicillium taxi]KAJ5899659.1 bzip family transcription factor [Penicillium taxi]